MKGRIILRQAFSATFILLFAVWSLEISSAQSPSPIPSNETVVAQELLIFKIRSAFSLTPAMVGAIQAKAFETSVPKESLSTSRATGSQAIEKSAEIPWSEALIRDVPFSIPLDVRIVGKNVISILQIVPVETATAMIELFVQSQVWVKNPDGSVSFSTTFQSINVALSSRIYFYPLGVDPKNGAPIAIEIKVERLTAK